MGLTAENVAERYDVSRDDMDRYAQRSQERAVAAQESGFFARELTPYTKEDGTVVAADDGPRPSSTYEKLQELQPAFVPDGKVTAGNSCPLNDGAAALVVMSEERAAEIGLKPRARIISSAVTGLDPEIMGVGPIDAVKVALGRAGMTIDDVDVVELNEAFAAQVIPVCRELGVDPFGEKLNPHGGAIALGHPYGMTGARIMCTLLNDLDTVDGTIGSNVSVILLRAFSVFRRAPGSGEGKWRFLLERPEARVSVSLRGQRDGRFGTSPRAGRRARGGGGRAALSTGPRGRAFGGRARRWRSRSRSRRSFARSCSSAPAARQRTH
jgi:hypothetical protein